MPKRQRRTRAEFWVGLIFVALLAYAFIAIWWKENPVLGWLITGSIVAILAFSIYRFPAFRGLLFKTTKTVGKNILYEAVISEREPMPNDTRMYIKQRAGNRCENPDCKLDIPPHIHHIDNDNRNNDPRNLIALCPNCHARAHRNEYSNSQLRVWVQRSLETSKRRRQRFRY